MSTDLSKSLTGINERNTLLADHPRLPEPPEKFATMSYGGAQASVHWTGFVMTSHTTHDTCAASASEHAASARDSYN